MGHSLRVPGYRLQCVLSVVDQNSLVLHPDQASLILQVKLSTHRLQEEQIHAN